MAKRKNITAVPAIMPKSESVDGRERAEARDLMADPVIAESVAVGLPATYEPAKLHWALRTLLAAHRDSKPLDPKTCDRAINLVAVALGVDPILELHRPMKPDGTREPRLAKLVKIAHRLKALAAYVRKQAAKEARATGKKPGAREKDRLAKLGMLTLVQAIFDEHSRHGTPKPDLLPTCIQAAQRLFKQEGHSRDDSDWAVPIWAEDARVAYNRHKKLTGGPWRPTPGVEVLLADDVKRGQPIGAKLPEEPREKAWR